MCGTQSARFWIVIRLPTSSRSRFASIGATKSRRRFSTVRFRLRRRCPKDGSRFAASEEPRYAITFQGRQGAKPTTIRRRCGEVGENHVNHQIFFKQEDGCARL